MQQADPPSSTSSPAAVAPRSGLDRYFKISERGSTVSREIRGGLVTFFSMCYIVVLNPLIIGTVPDSTGMYLGGGAEPNLPAVAAGTALIAGILSIFMGAWAKFPLALAAGLGLNAYLAYSVVPLPGMTWGGAMGMVLLEGVVILILVLTGFRKAVFAAVPPFLKTAIAVGIGLFIAFLGLFNAKFVTTAAGTPVQLGNDGSLTGWPTLVFVTGLLLMFVLWIRKVPGAILIAIVTATVLAMVIERVLHLGAFTAPGDAGEGNPGGWAMNVPALTEFPIQLPDFATLFTVDPIGGITAAGVIGATVIVFSLLLADFFDTMGTMVGVASGAGLVEEDGDIPHSQRILVVDSAAAIAGGIGGVSSNTSFVESTAGVAEGSPDRPGRDRGGCALPAVHLLRAAGGDGPLRGGDPGSGDGRVPDDDPDHRHRLLRCRDCGACLPHHHPHALRLLDHRRDGRGLRVVRADPCGTRQGP